ncbi:zinc finger and BTB domain-containing protein 7B-like [Arapaima gigas]
MHTGTRGFPRAPSLLLKCHPRKEEPGAGVGYATRGGVLVHEPAVRGSSRREQEAHAHARADGHTERETGRPTHNPDRAGERAKDRSPSCSPGSREDWPTSPVFGNSRVTCRRSSFLRPAASELCAREAASERVLVMSALTGGPADRGFWFACPGAAGVKPAKHDEPFCCVLGCVFPAGAAGCCARPFLPLTAVAALCRGEGKWYISSSPPLLNGPPVPFTAEPLLLCSCLPRPVSSHQRRVRATEPRPQAVILSQVYGLQQVAMSPGEDGLIGIPFPEHSNELLSCLNAQRRAGLLCDLTLTSRGARYSTHRSVMAAVSLYFRKLFGAEDGEAGDLGAGGDCSVCQLDCVAPDALDALLEFAYTATLTIRSSDMREVLKAAQLLGIQCVADACRDILGEADEGQEDGRVEDATQGSRRKRDRRHISRSTLCDPQPGYRSPPSSPPTERRASCATGPPSPEYDEHFPMAGQNGNAQHGGGAPGVTTNGNMPWAQQMPPLVPAAEDRLSKEEDKAEFRDASDSGAPALAEQVGVTGMAGSGRKRKSQTPQQCPVCQKIIHGAGKLPRHMRTHTGEKPFQCSACGVRFTRNDKLKIHMRKHTGERPYPCPHCNARFLHSYDLKNHLSLHSGARPFECSLCHKAFVREEHLQRHRKGHSCLEVRTRRPRRGAAGGLALGSSLLDARSLAHASTFPRSPPPPRANSSVHPLLYPPDANDPPIPLHALPLLGPNVLPYRDLLWRGMGIPGGAVEDLGAPDPSRGLQPPPTRWEDEEEEDDNDEEEEEDEEE